MDEAPNIRDYIGVIKHHRWMIIATVSLMIGAALTFTFLQPPKYSAEAQVLVQPITITSDQRTDTDVLNLETEALIATSPRVAQIAASELGESDSPKLLRNLEVTVAQDADVLVFTYTGKQASDVQQRTQAFADAYLEHRTNEAQDRLEAAVSATQNVLDRMQERLDLLNSQLSASPNPQEETGLIDEINTLNQQVVFERTTMLQLASPENVQAGQVLYEAQLPRSPSNPTLVNSGLIGLFAGLFVALGFAFLRERLDDRVGGRTDLEAAIQAPVLSVVPRVAAWKTSRKAYLVTREEPQSVASEAYRTLRSAILFASSQYDVKVLLVTSAHEKEGKSTTSANLAMVLGQAGKRVIVVSGDLRRPRLHQFFGVPDRRKGLTNLLAEEVILDKALVPVDALPGMVQLLHSGPAPGNPTELLGSDAMRDVMDQLSARADFVIVDIAPVLAVADAMTLARWCDGVLFIADATKSTQGAIIQARQQLEQVGARIIGGVLHNFDSSEAPSYAGLETPYAYTSDDRSPRASLRLLPWSRAKG
ncbi:MAG: polysaccharide biosynthesis tyrosine autokinase [Actinomycetota bacterium]